MEALAGLQEALARVGGQAGDSVVAVRSRGRGTGVVVAAGRVVTNAHNVVGARISVKFSDGRLAEAQVSGVDLDSDIAVLAVETGQTPPIPWDADGSNGSIGQGHVVFALGATNGGARVTWGTVSAVGRAFRGPRGRMIDGAVEHTAPLARGSSGGPLVDTQGRLLGVNTHRRGDGFYLAIPADGSLRQRVDLLGRGEQPTRVRLGVALAPSDVAQRLRAAVGLPERSGLLVRAVEDAGPAERAGIRLGDLLVEAAGTPLETLDDVFRVLDGVDPSATVTVRVVRGTDEHELTVRFVED
jgi:serine protease Do